ncbi:hypothetical protein K437DRAFT_293895 [Tilletiaria anomala UBC 951]|uniref:PQ-loop-domain-containing protein n=1 Tax=Tilletiaria anomala (strain ATCC 24038 / CBS 436.72 / UBC 951) TaxID=1037660 RepID=A0A066W7E0_TILAU|nr:uncharacterized protein K437DRAFT_293895 [Tilletiaria anomala UBC 951]KDN48448.1 hypothetical protein K437DRAFT_293895 [Tilletiaria anomala UBC 951]
MTLFSFLFSVGLAVGPPLIYGEQAYQMQQRRNSEGFSKDVCAVLLVANISRIYWWFGVHFEIPLLIQSILMIAAQLGLLYLCLYYRPGSWASSAFSVSSEDRQGSVVFDANTPGTGLPRDGSSTAFTPYPPFQVVVDPPPEELEGGLGHHAPSHVPTGDDRIGSSLNVSQTQQNEGVSQLSVNSLHLPEVLASNRPFNFWVWPDYQSYIWALLIVVAVLGIFQVLLGWSSVYVAILGTFALGLESMLPVPQLIQNHKRQSLAGFQLSVLGGWTLGDAIKSVYYINNGAPVQFIIFGLFQLIVDLLICAQAYTYRDKTVSDMAAMQAVQDQAVAQRRAERGEGESELDTGRCALNDRPPTGSIGPNGSPFVAEEHSVSPSNAPFAVGEIEADEDDSSSENPSR